MLKPPVAGYVGAPMLDEHQQRVVDHRGGPLLVLAGPGTGKTTTIVEAVAQRILSGEIEAEQALLLTFSRKAADEMRARISARIGGAHLAVPAMTFHSYSYALVREFGPIDEYEHPSTLITSQERERVISELIANWQGERWPDHIYPALATRGFAEEVQTFMDRVSALGMTTTELRERADVIAHPAWHRVAELADEFRDVLALRNLVDYPGLIDRAIGLASEAENREKLRNRHRLVIVDEYQDTDAMQVELLQQIAGDGAELIVVGDPDQSIYAFRGADQREILEFPNRFACAGRETPVVALKFTRRFGANILTASQRVLAGLPLPPGAVAEQMLEHRTLTSLAEDAGTVVCQSFVSATAEAESIAARLRRLHLDEGVPWRDMAVLVRNEEHLTRLARAFIAAGVPVETAGDEMPLYHEPAVRHVLSALEVADYIARERELPPALALAVLDGPIGGLDSAARRRLGRVLRRDNTEVNSEALIVKCLSEPVLLGVTGGDAATRQAVAKAKKTIEILHRAASDLRKHAPLEQVLWLLWDGSDWPRQALARWEQGGERRIAANRDLNAITALFRYLAKAEEQGRQRNVPNVIAELQAHQIPADQIGTGATVSDSVQLMTAHRAKGLEWPIVFVAGVQEGTWPNVRHVGSLLRAEELDGKNVSSRGAQLREERRLFYVACTRAARQLIVTAIDPVNSEADGPSRFFEELVNEFSGEAEPPKPLGRPRKLLTLRGVISQLRVVGEDAAASDADRLEAAKLVADITERDVAAARAADPARWWGLADWTFAPEPVRAEGSTIHLSASTTDAIDTCPLRWFLEREAGAGTSSGLSASVGSIVHAIAKDLGDRILDPDVSPPDLPEMIEHLDSVWNRLTHDSPWQELRERERAEAMLKRLDEWQKANSRDLIAAEHEVKVTFHPDDDSVILIGAMDRIERDPNTGELCIVDIKTGKTAPTQKSMGEHVQLGFYQVAIERGALGETSAQASAELVFVAKEKGTKEPEMPKVLTKAQLGEESPAREQMERAISVIRSEKHEATPCDACEYCSFANVCPTKTIHTVGADENE